MIAFLLMNIGIGTAATAAPLALIYGFTRYWDGVIFNGILTIIGASMALSAYCIS